MNTAFSAGIPPPHRVNLLFVIPSLQFGGAERQLVELLKLLRDSPYYSTVAYLTGFRSPNEQGFQALLRDLPKVEIVPIERRSKFDLIRPVAALVALARNRNSHIVCGHLNFGAMLALAVGLWTDLPVIADSIKDCALDRSPILFLCRRVQAWLADYLVSNSLAGFTVRFARLRSNFRVIPNVIDPRRFEGIEARSGVVREELGLERFSSIVGMVASMSTFKDHEAFLLAAAQVAESSPKTGFVLVGDGQRRPVIEQLIQTLGLADRVILAGGRADVDCITPLLDVACLFTNFRVIQEGLPNAILEAMVCGKPVIATWGGGTPEAVTHELTGFLVHKNDVPTIARIMLRLIEDGGLRRDVGERARRVVMERYSVEAQRAAYIALFEDLVYRSGVSLVSKNDRTPHVSDGPS